MAQNRISTLLQQNEEPRLKETVNAVLYLAGPAILEQLMFTALQYVDTAMVGRLGAAATAAVGTTSSTIWLFNGLFAAASIGFSVQVAQFLGARRNEDARSVTAQSLHFTLLFGLLTGGVGVLLSFFLPQMLNAAPEVAPGAGWYFRIIALGMPFMLGNNMISAILRCAGDTHSPMVLNSMINVLNMILNFLLIYPTRTVEIFGVSVRMVGAGWGIKGAATASSLATVIVFFLFLRILFHRAGPVQITKVDKLKPECLRAAMRLGLPVAMERVSMCAAQILITGMISGIGTVAVAANHLAVTAESLSYSPVYGVASAATALVGQATGARKKNLAMRFAKITTYIGIAMMTVGGALLFIFARPLIALFTTDSEVIELGTTVLRIVAFAEPFFGAAIVGSGSLRGAGDSRSTFLICLGTMWGVRITLVLLLAKPLGLVGVWLAMAAELFARGVVFMIRMFSGRWLQNDLFDQYV